MNKRFWVLLLLLGLALTTLVAATEETRLLRFPTIHGEAIVFTYAGDLYSAQAGGGTARKLTSHDGFEMFAHFSPDGKWLAFTGQYDGNTEVYLMPAEGGVPRRLTYTATLNRDDVSDRMGPNNIVMGWTHDGRHIVFRSRMREFDDFKGQLYLVPIDGGPPEQLPLPRGGFCSFSPDDKKLVYNRIFREFRTWKRYRGGMADDIWIYDFATKKTENITNNPAGDIIPMWSGNKIYFLSDRDDSKRMNLFVHDLANGKTAELTHFKEFDIKFPSLGDKAIVFENGGQIYKYELASSKLAAVPIVVHDDMATSRGALTGVAQNVNTFDISLDGKRALFCARGDIFTVPAESGITRNLTSTPGVHERNAAWSPDGKWIAFITDASGEDEIAIMPQDGRGAATALTTGSDTYKYAVRWSPDNKKIVWVDNKRRLRFVDVATKAVTEVDYSPAGEFRDGAWSPDSKWLAYTRAESQTQRKVYLYSLEQAKAFEVTDGWYAADSPAFSADGKYLFFASNRDFRPVYSQVEWNSAFMDMARIYLVTLAKDTESPFKPKNDEVAIAKDDSGAGTEKKPEPDKSEKPEKSDKPEKKEKKDVVVTVDLDGLKDRVIGLSVTPSNYGNLASVGDKLYYVRRSFADRETSLAMFDLGKRKETVLGDFNAFDLSFDRKKMLLVARRGTYAIIDVPQAKVDLKEPLDLSGMEVKLDRRAEWQQIYNECWRQMRDFFYAPNMHGVDWKAVHDKYQALLPFVNHRADLTYIIGEMIGELSAGHTYVGGGDVPAVRRISQGLLGAQLEKDPASGFFRIGRILKGENWDQAVRSPLTEVGVNAKEGDFITAVGGKSTKEMMDLNEALLGTAGKQVQLTLNPKPEAAGGREVIVIPTGNEIPLYYYNWVEVNIRKVSEATGGKVGYIHVPDMGAPGLIEFVKHFYPQLRKSALIIDVRGNGGGNVSPMLIERLRREMAMVNISRNGEPTPNPADMMIGPMVCLIDEFSASDGDLFPYRFKKMGLGPLIGKRTWGGVVGIRGSLPLLDGGFLNKPEFAPYDAEGNGWIIEGHGVDPDIVVDNDPAREYAGVDDQLNKAIEVIGDLLKTKGKTLPLVPPYPNKSK